MLTARLVRKFICSSTSFFPPVRQPHNKKTIYLTFDDGPHPIHSNTIMDVLAQYNIKATFFLIGSNIERDIKTANRMVQEGHLLGNHTYSHKSLPHSSRAEIILEIDKCQKIIDGLQYPRIRIFRPPNGLINLMDMIYLYHQHYKTMLWSIDSKDHVFSIEIESRLRQLTKSQNVILFHDDNSTCIEPLINLLPAWVEQGYQFAVPNSGDK